MSRRDFSRLGFFELLPFTLIILKVDNKMPLSWGRVITLSIIIYILVYKRK